MSSSISTRIGVLLLCINIMLLVSLPAIRYFLENNNNHNINLNVYLNLFVYTMSKSCLCRYAYNKYIPNNTVYLFVFKPIHNIIKDELFLRYTVNETQHTGDKETKEQKMTCSNFVCVSVCYSVLSKFDKKRDKDGDVDEFKWKY